MRRRYEVWFVRLGLADGSGAWWFRYLLLNPGRAGGGCPGGADRSPREPARMPLQVWATWFPRGAKPQTFIEGYALEKPSLSPRGASPFHFEVAGNRIGEDFCVGSLPAEDRRIAWNLRYRSTTAYTLSDKGWIGFSRTPHSDAIFSGEICWNEQTWRGEPLGYGVQGHNCGHRHRRTWTWAHAMIPRPDGQGSSTFEALEYEMPLGLRFRRALLWHEGQACAFSRLNAIERDRANLRWTLHCSRREDATTLVAVMDGSGISAHRLSYLKTNCSESFEVANNSFAHAKLYLKRLGSAAVELRTDGGAVVEMSGK